MMPARVPIAWRLPAGYAALVAALAAVALGVALAGANTSLFLALQQLTQRVPDPARAVVWESLSYAGDTLAAFALATILLARRPDMAWAGIVAAIPGGVVTQAVKALLPVARPPAVLDPQALLVLGPVLKQGSFPSGHSVTAGILAGIVCFAFPSTPIRAIALTLAVLIALSRIAVGVHWPVDVAAGLACGLICAWIGACIAAGQPWTRTVTARIGAALVFGGCAVALFFHSAGLREAVAFRFALAALGIALAIAAIVRALASHRANRGV